MVALSVACALAKASPEATWTVARSDHFEVYSEGDAGTARSALVWFEQLWAFFEQSGFKLTQPRPVRVIGFGSAKEYDLHRLRTSSDAYYAGTEEREYIVMPALGTAEFGIAAHEYAHVRLHGSGLKLPPWLNEGLAEFFSTVRISEQECYIGGELPMRLGVLQRGSWMPLSELVAVTPGSNTPTSRRAAPLFYAQSWALTEMLALSSEYGPRFPELVSKLGSGMPSADALRSVYAQPLDEIAADLREWVNGHRFRPVRLPGIASSRVAVTTSTLSREESGLLLADLMLANGE